MKIAIPLANGVLSAHFGHCQEFALVSVDPDTSQILSNQTLVPPLHEPGALPRWLHENGVTIIIAGGMGQRAQSFFNQYGIQVVIGALADTPEALVKSYLNNSLVQGQNLCDH